MSYLEAQFSRKWSKKYIECTNIMSFNEVVIMHFRMTFYIKKSTKYLWKQGK